jgi:dinuclear metal center YbgI/SA1388 family protein
MMKARDIAQIIEQYAPLSLQEEWDNAGFCIGDPDQLVSSLLVGFDCTASLIEEAIEKNADMVITHLPLIFGGIKTISPNNDLGRAIITAIKHDIVVYSAHTNIDKVITGVSGQMANRLNLNDIKILDEDKFDANVGLGVVGTLQQPLSPCDFVDLVKNAFSLKMVRSSKPTTKQICKVALCGGSGRSLVQKAKDIGADAYICGDMTYHDFVSDNDLMIIDIGHYESEIDIVKIFYNIVKEKFPTFAVQMAENKNLVYYF